MRKKEKANWSIKSRHRLKKKEKSPASIREQKRKWTGHEGGLAQQTALQHYSESADGIDKTTTANVTGEKRAQKKGKKRGVPKETFALRQLSVQVRQRVQKKARRQTEGQLCGRELSGRVTKKTRKRTLSAEVQWGTGGRGGKLLSQALKQEGNLEKMARKRISPSRSTWLKRTPREKQSVENSETDQRGPWTRGPRNGREQLATASKKDPLLKRKGSQE